MVFSIRYKYLQIISNPYKKVKDKNFHNQNTSQINKICNSSSKKNNLWYMLVICTQKDGMFNNGNRITSE